MTDRTISLEDIATHDVACLSVAATLGEAANLMAQRRFSSIVVVDDSRHPVGIVTERNILKVMHDRVPLDSPLRVGMSAPVITMRGDKDCLEAYQECLHAGIRHLVLVDDRNVVTGVVSETDFRSHLGLTVLAGRRKISSLAKHTAIALPPSCALTQAIELMQAQRKSCVIVVENEKPVGIVTERDMVRFYSGERSYTNLVLEQVMVAPVLTIPRSATTHQAAEKMLSHKVRHLVAVDDEGRMVGLVSEHDLTQVMIGGLAEERAGIEESFLRILLDTLPDLVWLKDEQGVYLACNRRFEMFFGVQESEIIGKTDYDFVSKEQADFFRENDRKAMAEGKPSVNEEWLTFSKDGYRGLFETIKTPMHDSRGHLNGVIGVARDITERERAKRTLIESEREFRTLAESLPDNVIRYDRDCRVHYMNPSMARTINPELLPLVGELPVDAAPDSSLIRDLQSMVERVMDSGERVETEFEIKHPDGSLHWHHVIFVPELNKEGAVVGALGIGRDINDRKRAERLNQELHADRMATLQAIPDLLFELDVEGRYLNIWAHDPALLAAQKDILLGHTANEMLPLEAARTVMSALQEAGEKGYSHGQIIHLKVPQGDSWFELSTSLKSSQYVSEKRFIMLSRDITERKQAEKSLRESSEKLRALYELSPLGIALTDMNGKYVEFNDAFRDICGYELEELRKLDYWALTPKKYAEEEARQLESLKRSGRYGPYEKEYIRKDGSLIPLRLNGVLVTGRDGNKYIWSIVEDITESKRGEENLRITASVFENTREAIILTDTSNRIIDANPAFAQITGYTRDEVLGKNPRLLSSGKQDNEFYSKMWQSLNETGSWRGEIWNRRKSGELYAELLSISAIRDDSGQVQRYVGVFSDITNIKEYEAELRHVANYDVLTGIPNRRLLADRLRQAVAVAQRGGKTLAICYIDLDGFKEVNDMFGHEKGDQLLVEVTHLIQNELRAGDTVARLGGDEFTVVFNDLAHEKECFQILERLMQAIASPVQLGANSVVVSASVGVAFYPADGEDGETLLKNADRAMYIAKQNGKNRFHYHKR